MGVAEKIKAIRDEKRIKQIDVANSLNLDPSYYARLEKRGEKMTIEQLQGIADALGVSLGEILGIEGKKASDESDRIKALEKEVGYLKRIIDSYESNQTSKRDMIGLMIFSKIATLAGKLQYGTCILRHIETGIVFKVKGEEALLKFLEERPEINEGIENGTVEFKIEYSENEIHTIRAKLIESNHEYWELLDLLDYIEDPEFRDMIRNYPLRSHYLSNQIRV